MDIQLPKKAPTSLIKRAEKVKHKIIDGTAKLRKSERYGYWTIALGHCERAVLLDGTLFVFNTHRAYERFLNSRT